MVTNESQGKNAGQGANNSSVSHNSHPILPPRGDYQTLLSFQKAEVVYDSTFRFAHKYLSRGERMTRARLDYRNRQK